MSKFRFFLILIVCFLLTIPLTAQNDVERRLNYGDTVSGIFASDSDSAQEWLIDVQENDVIEISVRRIGGIFSPEMLLLDPSGNEISPFYTDGDEYGFSARYQGNITQSGLFRIVINQNNSRSDGILTQSEYSLTVQRRGQFPQDFTGQINPLIPVITATEIPDYFTEEGRPDDETGIEIIGEATIQRVNIENQLNRFEISGSVAVQISNTEVIAPFMPAISFHPDSVALQMSSGAVFITDEDIADIALESSILTIRLQSGLTVSTDFYAIEAIQVIDGITRVRLINGHDMIFDGLNLRFTRRGGISGEGPNAEPILIIQVDDARIETDMVGWDVFSILDNDADRPTVQTIYANDLLFQSDELIGSYTVPGNQSQDNAESNRATIRVDYEQEASVGFDIELNAAGIITLANQVARMTLSNGTDIPIEFSDLENVIFDSQVLRLERRDNTVVQYLPDSTIITSPPSRPADSDVLPFDNGFRPQNFNNSGTTVTDYHPQVDMSMALEPVNRVIGNFVYSVEDISVPGHALTLNWERTYNSIQADERDTPQSFLSAHFGRGWRHSYHYELDTSFANVGEVQLTLADGSIHIFEAGNDNLYRSNSLLSWIIKQQSGFAGNWIAYDADGIQYHFDTAGRLQRITHFHDYALLFSPAPQRYLDQFGADGGFFVTEHYGRRLEIYTDADSRIIAVRGVQGRIIRYEYVGDLLVGVNYFGTDYSASYGYDGNGYLNAIDDVNSPFTQRMALEYNDDGQVTSYDLNPDDNLTYILSYQQNRTIETALIDGETDRETIWEFDGDYRLTRWTLPDTNQVYEWIYVPDTGLLSEIIQPTRTRLRFRYDEAGYLTRFTDPQFGTVGFYGLSYITGNDHTRLLSQIDTPSITNWKSYTYDDETNLLTSIDEAVAFDGGARQPLITQFDYDDENRIATITDDNDLVTHYEYDDFGYPSLIEIESATGEEGQNWQLLHDGAGRLLTARDIDGRLISLRWHSDRALIEQITVADRIFTYDYDERDNLVSYVSPDEMLSYEYDTANQVISVTDAMPRTTNYAYDDYGNLVQLTLANGSSSYTYAYDNMDQLIQEIAPDGYITNYDTTLNIGDNSSRTVYSVTDALNETIRYEFDPIGRLRLVTYSYEDAPAYNIGFDYNARGNVLTVREGDSRPVTFTYNSIGYLTGSTLNDGLQTRYAYNTAGLLAQITNPAEQITTYGYDFMGNPTQVDLPGAALHYAYDNSGNIIGYTDAEDNQYFYSFDDSGQLLTITNPAGGITRYVYDSAGNITGVFDPNGNETVYLYDDTNRLLRVTTPANQVTRYGYDDIDNPIQIIEPNGLQTDYTYDSSNNVVAQTQPQDREYLYSRDAGGRITAITNPAGNTTTYAYNVIGEIGRITNPSGNSETFGWFGNGELVTYQLLNGTVYQYRSDDFGRLIQANNTQSGQNSLISYDATGNITRIQDGNEIYQYTYDERGNIATYLPPGAASPYIYEYDANNRVTRITDPENVETTYVYDEAGHITGIIYEEGVSEESFVYDAAGNIVESTSRDGITRIYEYDAVNRLISVTVSGTNLITTFEYDGAGNVIRLTEPGGRETNYLYDLFGNLLAVEQTRTEGDETVTLETTYSYDSTDNLLSVTSPGGETINMTYNNTGQRVRYIDAADNSWSYSYSDNGNLEQLSNPLGANLDFEYDNANRIVSITFEQDTTVEFTYNNGYLSRITLPENGAGRTEILQYTLEPGFNLVGIGHVSSNGVSDDLGITRTASGLIETIRTTNAEITIAYDDYGNIAAISVDDSAIRREYDAAGRLISLRQDNIEHRFTYDDNTGQLLSMVINEVSLDEEGEEQFDLLLSSNYEFDDYGNLISRNIGEIAQIQYEYDGFNRPTIITFGENDAPQVEIDYNLNGWRSAVRRQDSVTTSYVYDENGRVESIAHTPPGEARAYSFNYEYDAAGNLIRLTRSDNNSILYSYDDARQLIGERWLDDENQIIYAVTYSYDAVGNRIEQTARTGRSEPSRTAFIYNSLNQLDYETRNVDFEVEDRANLPFVIAFVLALPMLWYVRRNPRRMPIMLILLPFAFPLWQGGPQAVRDVDYDYDSNGNLVLEAYIDGRQIVYEYDAFNRLIGISETASEDANPEITSIQYDSTGRVVRIVEHDLTYDLIYDAYGLIAVRDGDNLQVQYSPAQDDTLFIQRGETSLWTIDDGAGQFSRFATESGGFETDVIPEFSRNAFGESIFEADAQSVNVDFLEQIHLSESNIVLMGVRAYHPRIGRFLQRDPVRHDPRGNLYTFAYNNPLSFSDPTGMIPESASDGIVRDIPVINPMDYVMMPSMPAIPDVPDVATLQEDENHRMLDLAYTMQFDVNEMILVPATSACDLFLHTVNPINDLQRSQIAENRQDMLAMYGTDGWLPELPQPGSPINPLSRLDDLEQLLSRSLQGGQTFQTCPQALELPEVPVPVTDEFFANLSELPALLEQTDFYSAAIIQIPELENLAPPIVNPAAISTINLDTDILPDVTGQVGDLQENTASFYMDLLLPLADNGLFRWQTGYQANNVAPIQAIEIEN